MSEADKDEHFYPDNLIVKDALEVYFSKYHFKDGGYQDKFFKIKMGPFYLPLPNIKDRVDAVKIHDINHVITGYKANYRGEAQIGGWELATGCGKYYVAWGLNLGSFLIGLLAFPCSLFNAFMTGRRVRKSLYRNKKYDEALLNSSLGELRQWLYEGACERNSIYDRLLFVVFSLLSLIYIAPLILVAIILC